jgi:hypothetical protein
LIYLPTALDLCVHVARFAARIGPGLVFGLALAVRPAGLAEVSGDRVGGGVAPPPPTPPDMRARIRRFVKPCD